MKRSFLVVSLLALSALAQQSPTGTVKGLKAAPGLEVALWAGEPRLTNPTNIDIDARGRIWVLEAVNYRRQLRGEKDIRSNGARILILEDADLDGKADKVKVFDQNIGLRAPLGIAVFGNQVVVSQSPDLIVYTKDEDDRIVKKEVLLTGWKGVDHDHGLHAVTFGPDGRYYFNSGDQGFDVTDRSGNRFVSAHSGPYYAGAALRVNPDGTGFTVLGHNFRNPYELALDSFGNIWQTDNDDDGNAWVRVNYVMQGGNFGYWGPGGRSWREDKGSHFHSELPGVTPNIARTGAGSPCGLVVYEGTLLPERYRGHLLHAEAGKRLINAYFLSPDGAGFKMRTEDTVSGPDTWFRPSDVAVAPDGAVYISDWYDPGVGGHQMKDIDRGRIYRLAPPGYKPSAVPVNLETAPGRAAALRSPAQSVRYLAWQRLKDMGEAATGELRGMTKSGDPVLRARALWLLGEPEARAAVRDADPNFRILGIRLLEARGADLVEATRPLLRDPSPQVRREIAVALRNAPGDAAVESLAELARQHDGQDRWYLEALGIGARGRENALYAKLKRDRWDAAYGQLLWEFRPSDALSELIPAARRNPEALTALAASASLEAGRAVAGMVVDAGMGAQALAHLSTRLFSEWIELRKDPPVVAAIRQALGEPKLQASALELVDDLEDPVYGPELQALARSESAPEETRGAAIQALGKTRNREYLAEFQRLMKSGPLALRVKALRAIGYIGPAGMEGDLRKLILSKEPNELRSEAVRVLARSGSGLAMLLDLEQKSELPAEMRTLASNLANMSRDPAIRARAAKLLPRVAGKNQRPLPPPMFLVRQQGDPQRGRQVFMAQEGPKCSGCHNLGEGKPKAGPDLANIGTKLGKDALLDSILNPSAGIAPEFCQWILQTRSQGEVIGVIAEDTPQRVVVRTENGGEIRLKPSDIASRRKSNLSMMPEDLVQHVTEQQLVDLLEFLATLKK